MRTLPADAIEARPPPTKAEEAVIRAAAERLFSARSRIEKLAEKLRAAEAEARRIEEVDLPRALLSAGRSRFELGSGWRVETERFANATVDEEDRPAAAAFVGDVLGREDLVKHAVTVSFPRAAERAFKKFLKDLARRKVPLDVEVESSVHPATLSKLIRERVALEDAGEVAEAERLPRDLFKIYAGTRAVLVGPKKERAK